MSKVAIITGASRGIGREFALALARKGYSIVIAAKTAQADPRLPGTIFSVADEVRALGVEALPVQADVRDVGNIDALIAKTMAKFGRIDVVLSNAGALWWRPVAETPIKRFDLVHEVNSRATFALARAAAEHMTRQGFGHIVTMSPPIDLAPSTLKGKVGYLMSKYGMTIVAHGLGEELRGTGVAVNALWPATLIESTAVINNKVGNRAAWRKPQVMVDALMLLLEQDPKVFTGRAIIDEDFLRRVGGVTDFKQYRCDPNVEPPRITEAPTDNIGGSYQEIHGQKSKL